MSIELYGRGDRLGANITTMIAQIICAVENKYFIHYNRNFINHNDYVRFVEYNQKYSKTIFMESLFDFIDEHNKNCNKDAERVRIDTIHFFTMISSVVFKVKLDLVSYFKKYIQDRMNIYFNINATRRDYFNKIPFIPSKTIVVHLRLDDVRHYPDYDGRKCSNFFRKVIDSDNIADNHTHALVTKVEGHCNSQAPLSNYKINRQIEEVKQKYPDHRVIIVTNPGEITTDFPYEYIQSEDESFDLFLLCNADVLILSRSTFAISSLFFAKAREIYLPLWGHLPCFGLYTKYDECKFNYFY
jgi:hypothetical protein